MYNDERFLNEIERQWNEFKGNKKNVQQAKVFSSFLQKVIYYYTYYSNFAVKDSNWN